MKRNTFYCFIALGFTPLVTFITFLVEGILALYVLLRYGRTLFGILAVIFIAMLAGVQVSEFFACQRGYSLFWAKAAYLSFHFLPVLGFHMISLVTKKSRWVKPGYAIAAFFAIVILVVPGIFLNLSCTGRFITYDTVDTFDYFYASYYFGFLLLGVLKLLYSLIHKIGDKVIAGWWLVAYAAFIVPVIILYITVPSTRVAIPSIMCGFALIAAIVLVGGILPRYQKIHLKKKG